MDAEYSFLSHEESLDLQEAYVKALIQGALDRAPQALEILERDIDLLKNTLQNHSNVYLTMMLSIFFKNTKMMKMLIMNT